MEVLYRYSLAAVLEVMDAGEKGSLRGWWVEAQEGHHCVAQFVSDTTGYVCRVRPLRVCIFPWKFLLLYCP